MTVRITFRSEVYIKGDSLKEIIDKWVSLPLYSVEALSRHHAELVELESVEDAETFKDLIQEWYAEDEGTGENEL